MKPTGNEMLETAARKFVSRGRGGNAQNRVIYGELESALAMLEAEKQDLAMRIVRDNLSVCHACDGTGETSG